MFAVHEINDLKPNDKLPEQAAKSIGNFYQSTYKIIITNKKTIIRHNHQSKTQMCLHIK